MTDILCSWLNGDLGVSQKIEKKQIAAQFASGYLLGEVLHKYELQSDFHAFSQSNTADSKLNNFTRIEPTLLLLGIPFDVNVARDIMQEKPGVATRLLYQVFIALENKRRSGLTGVAMDTMRTVASVKMANMEKQLYKERIKQVTPRQTDINLQELVERFHQHRVKLEERAFNLRIQSAEQHRHDAEEHRRRMLNRSKDVREEQKNVMERIEAAIVHIPKPPPNRTAEAMKNRRVYLKQIEAKQTLLDVDAFDERLQRSLGEGGSSSGALTPDLLELYGGEGLMESGLTGPGGGDPLDWIKPASNEDYIGQIRRRLEDDVHARTEREKRRRKVLVDCLVAHQEQAEAQREESMANRLMRQSQLERRIAVQLLQTRHEKVILKMNRQHREEQYQQRREIEFQEALDKEKELCRQARLACIEQLQAEEALHASLRAAERENKYQKHFNFCRNELGQIADLACRVAEYREFITAGLTPSQQAQAESKQQVPLPPYIHRNLLITFLEGQPFYDTVLTSSALMEDSAGVMVLEDVSSQEAAAGGDRSGDKKLPLALLKNEKERVLDEGELLEYRNMTGEWNPPEISDIKLTTKNPILGWIIDRLHRLVYPPSPPPDAPAYPACPIKAAVLGKSFSGKSSLLKMIAQNNYCLIIQVDQLMKEALKAYQEDEKVEEIVKVPDSEDEEPPVAQDASAVATDSASTAPAAAPPAPAPAPAATATATAPGAAPVEGAPAPAPPKVPRMKEVIQERASDRAQLGLRVDRFLKKGRAVDDPTMVDLITEYLKRLPAECGWILDGFPNNYTQAQLLEKALTGYVPEKTTEKAPKGKKGATAALTNNPRPPPPKPTPKSGLDLVILLDIEDVNCFKRATGRVENVSTQAQYHLLEAPPPEGSITGMQNSVEPVAPVTDPANDMEQLQKRLTHFLEAWPKMEKFYTSVFQPPLSGSLVKTVNANQALDSLRLEAEALMEEALFNKRVELASETLVTLAQELEAKLSSGELVPPPPPEEEMPEPPPIEQPPSDVPPLGSGKKRTSRNSSARGSARSRSNSGEKKASPKPAAKGKRPESADSKKGSPKRTKSATKRGKASPKPEEPAPEEPAGPPPPEPGSEEWKFVDFNVPMEVASILIHLWETIESSYLENAQGMFRLLRGDRESIIQYFYRVRVHFLEYLRRPNSMQEFINQFQKDFNEVPDELRRDEEVIQELHQRVDDLRDKLFEISCSRKEAAEKRCEEIQSSGWLDDRVGLLTNHYLSLMQGEFHRFQDTVRLMKDYYHSLKSPTPVEYRPDYVRLPLLELPVEQVEDPNKSSPQTTSRDSPGGDGRSGTPLDGGRPGSGRSGRGGTPRSRKNSPTSKKAGTGGAAAGGKGGKGGKDAALGSVTESGIHHFSDSEIETMFRTRIPLLSLRPSSSDILTALNQSMAAGLGGGAGGHGGGGKGAGGKAGGKGGAAGGKDKKGGAAAGAAGAAGGPPGPQMTHGTPADWLANAPAAPTPPQDPDAKTLHAAFTSAMNFIQNVITHEHVQMEADEENERNQQMEREKERERVFKEKQAAAAKAAGKGKGGKRSRTPSPKKRDGTPTPGSETPTSWTSDEEKLELERSENMRKEFFAAMSKEAKDTRTRMALIVYIAAAIIDDLKSKADNVYNDLRDWIGARMLKENELVEGLTEVLRSVIEKHTRIHETLRLTGDDFFVDRENTVLEPAPNPTRPPPVDIIEANEFKIKQLRAIYDRLYRVAPSGHMSVSEFTVMLQELRDLCEEPPAAATSTVVVESNSNPAATFSLPEPWRTALPSQLTELAEALSWDHDYVNWRRFLLAIALIPLATQQELLDLLREYETLDQSARGYLTREQYASVPLWMEKDYVPPATPSNPLEPKRIDRTDELKSLIFDMFKEQPFLQDEVDQEDDEIPTVRDTFMINYRHMLMHFCLHSLPLTGLERALSVRVGYHVPHLPLPSTVTSGSTNDLTEKASDDDSIGVEDADIPLECLFDVITFDKQDPNKVALQKSTDEFVEEIENRREGSIKHVLELSYQQLGSLDLSPLPFSQLLTHSYIVEILAACQQFKYIDPKNYIGDAAVADAVNSARTEKGNE